MLEATWGRLAIVLRTGLAYTVWLIGSHHNPGSPFPVSPTPRRFLATVVKTTMIYTHMLNVAHCPVG